MVLSAIGIVRNAVKQPPGSGHPWQDITSEIIIDDSLTEALDGLEDFSHLIVLYWLHRVDRSQSLALKIHPRGNPSLPLMGLLATRSPQRPNPVGKATVKLLLRRKNILKVKGLDAIDGTPVLDIKPFIPRLDAVKDATIPSWVN